MEILQNKYENNISEETLSLLITNKSRISFNDYVQNIEELENIYHFRKNHIFYDFESIYLK